MYSSWQTEPFGFRSMTPAVRVLLIVTLAGFAVQLIGDYSAGGVFTKVFGLSLAGLMKGQVWQVVTYMFLHAGFLHILSNMLGLFFFGPEVERTIGTRRFALLYLGCGVLGGLGWLLISGTRGGGCIGASGSVFGVLGAFAAIAPHRPVTLLLLLVIPVTIAARTLAIGLGLFTLVSLVMSDGNIAHAAHLAGGIVGYLYGLRVARRGPGVGFRSPQWMDRVQARMRRHPLRVLTSDERPPPTEDEVDEVLDKVSRTGFQSLSRHEREILERASHTYRRR